MDVTKIEMGSSIEKLLRNIHTAWRSRNAVGEWVKIL